MIEVKNLSKSFDSFKALDNLELNVPDGAVYGLVGPNGAGKTTLIRHLAGIYCQDSGSITVNGENVYENAGIKSKIGYIPDEVFYYPQATVSDMKNFYSSIYPRFDEERYEKLGEILDIDSKKPMRRLSRGMQKQAAFRLVLSCRPEIILLDEPVDGLDPVMRRNIWSLVLSDVAESGTTVLVSSHNLRELEDVCDHVGIMDKGRMLLERSLSDLQNNIVKVQAVFDSGCRLPEELDIVNRSRTGRLEQLVIRGKANEIEELIAAAAPVYFEAVPLNLEEIFIYELGGAGYEVKNIII